MRARALGLTAALVLGAAFARADTPMNPWDAVRDPAAAERYALHQHVRELLGSLTMGPRTPMLLRARTLLEEAHAEESPDVRLRFDLGEVYELIEDYTKAIDVLRPALDLAPDQPGSVSAFIRLANAYARLDRSDEERRMSERFLPMLTDDMARPTAMLNLAEAHMHLGELEDAIAGYKATIDLAAQLPNPIEQLYHTGLLSVWGLAVALDRSGDLHGGAKEAALAVVLDKDMNVIQLNPDVFFVPKRERNWYVALGFTEYATGADDARSAAVWWARAEGCWREYVADVGAHGGTDRWLEVARARLDRAHAQRVVAMRRAKMTSLPPLPECVR